MWGFFYGLLLAPADSLLKIFNEMRLSSLTGERKQL
jgi:hypothetical protein